VAPQQFSSSLGLPPLRALGPTATSASSYVR
jgi:hypothetical protein